MLAHPVRKIASFELAPFLGVVVKPLTERSAWRDVLQPVIDLKRLPADTAGAHAVDENPLAFASGGPIGPLQCNVHGLVSKLVGASRQPAIWRFHYPGHAVFLPGLGLIGEGSVLAAGVGGVPGPRERVSLRLKTLPTPGVLRTAMSPPWARANARARLRPRPFPGCDRLLSQR